MVLHACLPAYVHVVQGANLSICMNGEVHCLPAHARMLQGAYLSICKWCSTHDAVGCLPSLVRMLQGAYLSICMNHMSEAVTTAFPGGTRTLPSPSDVQKCIG